MKYGILFILFFSKSMVISACAFADNIPGENNCDIEYNKHKEILKNKEIVKDIQFYKNMNGQLSGLIKQCENHPGLLVLVANSCLPLQKNLEALSYATKALHIDPKNAEAMYTKGAILSVLGDKEGSIELIKKSVETAPENLIYKRGYCSTLELFGEYKKAISVCSELINKYEAPAIIYFIRSRAYKALGDDKNAQKDNELYEKLNTSE